MTVVTVGETVVVAQETSCQSSRSPPWPPLLTTSLETKKLCQLLSFEVIDRTIDDDNDDDDDDECMSY